MRSGFGASSQPVAAIGPAAGPSAAQAEQREHRAEIGDVDRDIRLLAHDGLRAECDAERSAPEHLEVVRSVAHGDGA